METINIDLKEQWNEEFMEFFKKNIPPMQLFNMKVKFFVMNYVKKRLAEGVPKKKIVYAELADEKLTDNNGNFKLISEASIAQIDLSVKHFNKNKKNLLNPRFEVIANYPESIFKKGDILEVEYKNTEIFNLKRCGKIKFSEIKVSNIEEYSHLFRKLNWWEYRKIEEMPKYLKDIDFNDVCKIDKWTISKDGTVEWHSDKDKGELWETDYLPATKQEYENYINQINSYKSYYLDTEFYS